MAPSCASFLRLFLGVLLLTCCPPYLEDKGTPLALSPFGTTLAALIEVIEEDFFQD